MANLNGHEAGNGGYSQEETCSHYATILLGSPEILIVSEVDAVHLAVDNILTTVTGEVIRARRGLRPCQDVKELI